MMVDPSVLVKQAKALKARNKELEATLANLYNVLNKGNPATVTVQKKKKKPQPVTVDPEKKVRHNRLQIPGISYYGQGSPGSKKCLYQCDFCKKIGQSRIKNHICPAKEIQKNKKPRRKEKIIPGFTLLPRKQSGCIFYRCDHCHVNLLETSTTNHKCTRDERPVPVAVDAFIMDETLSFAEEEEEDHDNPLYRGQIPGWQWHSYNNGYSLYQCERCHISMRHDYVHKHQCTQLMLVRSDENDIVL